MGHDVSLSYDCDEYIHIYGQMASRILGSYIPILLTVL